MIIGVLQGLLLSLKHLILGDSNFDKVFLLFYFIFKHCSRRVWSLSLVNEMLAMETSAFRSASLE